MPKQIHEVKDPKKLRRAVQTQQAFGNKSHFEVFISPHMMYTGALTWPGASLGGTGYPIQMPTGVDSDVHFHHRIPDYIGSGSLRIKLYVSQVSATGGDFYFEVRGRALRNDNATGQLLDATYGATQQAKTYPVQGNAHKPIQFDWETDTFYDQTANDSAVEMITWRVSRLGTNVLDTNTSMAQLWGVLVEFQEKITWTS